MKKNEIIGEIIITEKGINKDIRIISSYEEAKRNHCYVEKEIKDNIEIIINNEKIYFSYFYKFKGKGIYKIIYSFKSNLTNIECLLCECSSFIKFKFK